MWRSGELGDPTVCLREASERRWVTAMYLVPLSAFSETMTESMIVAFTHLLRLSTTTVAILTLVLVGGSYPAVN